MKIKTKKQLNLPQLIEWLLESGKSECIVISNMNNIVQLEPYGVIRFSQEKFYPEETFTVTIEEEITEDTKVSKLAHYSTYGFKGTKNNTSINDVKDKISLAFYIMNSDRTMTLIWTKEKGLVE